MVMFWIAAGALTLGVVALIMRPLVRKGDPGPTEDNPDIAIYRSQLRELERDVTAGAIGAEEAKSARAEISRRLLAAGDEAGASSAALSSRQRLGVALLVCLIMPALATLVYLQKGRPDYAATPYTDRSGEAELWTQYGRAYMRSKQFTDAEASFRQAIELSEPDGALYERLGEAIILGGDGSISEQAIAVFEKAIKLDPGRERSRYMLAEQTWRSGDREAGVRAFIDILEETRDESFQVFLKERIDSAIRDMKAGLSGDPEAMRPESETSSGPLADMSEPQRVRINQMVERLAMRLVAEPNDIEGWLRLIRSYTVLQDKDKMQEALQTATFNFLDQPESLQKILALTEELDLARGPELPEGAQGLEVP